MNIDENVVESIVKRVVSQLSTETASAQTCPSGGDWGVFESMNDAVDAAVEAQREYLNRSMHDRACYVQAIRDVVLDQENLEYISRLAVEETGMGGYEYKLIKNRLAAVKTPGIEDLTTDAMSGDDGLTLVEYSPFGVIGSITPTTNPTETIICNSIGMLAAGNAVVFSPHPRAKKVSLHLIQLINKALCKAGAPANLVVTVSAPSIENTNAMMSHPKIRMLVATGGPAIVKTVLSSGKKAIGAGAGNPPVVVDETADIEKAAKDIVDGCSFDNNLPCIAEKEVIAVDSVADYLIFNMKKNGAYEVKAPAVISQLVELVTKEGKSPKTEFVGKSAKYILDKIGKAGRKNYDFMIPELNMGSPVAEFISNSGTTTRFGQQGYVMRLNYNYAQKYMLELAGRYDQTYQYAPDRRSAFFPSVSLGWRLSEESFIKDNFSFINNLKLRASYGKSGNPVGDAFSYLSQYKIENGAVFGKNPTQLQSLVEGAEPNIFLTWETVWKANIGL